MTPGVAWIGPQGRIVRILEVGPDFVTLRGIENAHNWNRVALSRFLVTYRPARPVELEWINDLPPMRAGQHS